MDDIADLKYDIDRKLEKETTNLSTLRESLKKSSTNTQNMLGILTSFESRLQRLEDTIVPVYNETENLRRRQENIEKTLHTVDNVLGYYHAAKDVEPVIREGPGASDLDTYISYMDKLLRAMRYFTTNNPASKELDQLTRIYDDGKENLQHEFRALLTRHGRPVPPILIMDLLGTDEELPPVGTDTDLFALEHLPEKVVEQLSDISKWLVANDSSTEFTKYYYAARASMLTKSLQGLKEHLKTSSGSSTTHVGQHSPAMNNKFRGTKDTPVRKSMKKMTLKGFKKASSTLMAGRSPFEPGHRRQGSSTESMKEEHVDVETDQYITQLTALLRLMQSESHLMMGIIPEKYQRNIFDNTVQQALDMIVSEGEMLATTAKRNIGRHEFTAVLSIFPIVKHLRTVRPEFDLILEGCQAPTRSKLISLLSTLDSTGAKALEEFHDSVRNDSDKAMPRDGTVHELANHTIIFLEQLQDYAETAGAMLLMHGEQAAPSQSTITTDACRLRLADYMTRVLSALGLNLTNKAEMYSDPALKPIFMLNNFNYILKSLKRSGLLELLHAWNPQVADVYETQITEQKRSYSESWNKVLHFIMEVDKPISVQRTQNTEVVKLKDKDRQNIKDRFTGFNKELEEIYKIQKGYAVPDPELRESLKADNKKYITLRYEVFLNKYKSLNFTKNTHKYIKYDVVGVESLIDKFFDASA
ncbi:exocyst complex component 7-like [Haliotis cracherodii]|uniref:exocyst complex component 7-like n=1 Tax=Haliotis cracherodii TaxID=6455 RepID=UPI0039EB19BE